MPDLETLILWLVKSHRAEHQNLLNATEKKFSDFEKSSSFMRKNFKPSSIRTIGIVAYGRDHKAEIEVSKINIF